MREGSWDICTPGTYIHPYGGEEAGQREKLASNSAAMEASTNPGELGSWEGLKWRQAGT